VGFEPSLPEASFYTLGIVPPASSENLAASLLQLGFSSSTDRPQVCGVCMLFGFLYA